MRALPMPSEVRASISISFSSSAEQINARTSDAIALAVRFDCPIFTYEFILSAAGIILEDQPKESGMPTIEEPVVKKSSEKDDKDLTKKSTEELKELLKGAIDGENYE